MRADLRNRVTTTHHRATRRVKWVIKPNQFWVAFHFGEDGIKILGVHAQIGIDGKGALVWPAKYFSEHDGMHLVLYAIPTGTVDEAREVALHLARVMQEHIDSCMSDWTPPPRKIVPTFYKDNVNILGK